MTVIEFLEKLQKITGGKIIKEDGMGNITEISKRPFSRLYADYRKHYIKVDFIDAMELLLEVNMTPPHRLLLRPESVVSKLLDKINLSAEIKIGDDAFDSKYIIQNATVDEARKTINAGFKEALSALEPFLSFEMTAGEYKLVKQVDIASGYTPENAAADLEKLITLADRTKGKA